MNSDKTAPAIVASLLARTQAIAANSHAIRSQSAALREIRNAAALRADADALLLALVDDARNLGATWQEVGKTLGISRQAAYQRFGQVTDPRTGRPLAKDPYEGAAARAVDVFELMSQGKGSEVYAGFDDTMRQAMTAEQLGDVWANVLTAVGALEGHGEPVARRMNDLTVVDVPLHFEAGEMVGRLALRKSGEIAGLFIIDAEAAGSLS